MRRVRVAVVTALVGLAACAWMVHGGALARRGSLLDRAPATASLRPNASQAAAPIAAPNVGPATAAVAAEVERRNVEAQTDRRAFVADGWTMIQTAPPDESLIAFDPALLDTREPELRAQLLSAAAPPERAPQILAIAEHAKDPSTRIAAAESLGRMGRDGQAALADLIAGGKLAPGDPARAVAIAAILPPIDDAERRADLKNLAASNALSADEKKQLSAAIAQAEPMRPTERGAPR